MPTRSIFPACWLVAAAVAAGAVLASEQKAYKYVDEKGNITYSQTPPVAGKEAKKVDITPAHAGRGGQTTGAGEPNYNYNNPYQTYDYQRQQQQSMQKYNEAQKKRLDDLKAECSRNRGTDCDNPETLRNMEAQRIPRAPTNVRR